MELYDFGNTIISEGVDYSRKGDFLGFTIGSTHSSELGIVRISDSNRYTEDLIPEHSEKTATSSGLDMTYYFDSNYTQKKFTIKFAFDSLTEIQLRKLRQIFSKKEPQDLIFDETPYKVYSVKIDGQPQLSYLCFDEDYKRVYKGDGSVSFIAYYPFARSRFKYIEDYNIQNIPEWGGMKDNKSDWLESSGIISKNTSYILSTDSTNSISNYIDANHFVEETIRKRQFIPVKNVGDLETNIKIRIYFYPISNMAWIDITNNKNLFTNKKNIVSLSYTDFNSIENKYEYKEEIGRLEFKIEPYELAEDIFNNKKSYLEIDMEKELIFYHRDNLKSIYNNNIISGNFFKIPKTNNNEILVLKLETESLDNNAVNRNVLGMSIDYDYLYY